MDAILEPLLASPALPEHLRTLEELLARERARRERFYEEMDESQKVEFINGEIIVYSPAKIRHVDSVTLLLRLLSLHVDRHDLGWVGSEKGLICLTRNDYEPDIIFYGKEKAALLQPDQMKLPAPDFIAEVLSPSTERFDRGIKLQDYAAHGVQEYWIIDPVGEGVEQHVLSPAEFSPASNRSYSLAGFYGEGQNIVSAAVPGFRLPVRALFNREANLQALSSLTA